MVSNREGLPMFAIQDWQRQYAEALIETDPAQLPTKIMLAEGSIAARALELCDCSTLTGENADLANALDELTVLLRRLSPSMAVFSFPVRPESRDTAAQKGMPLLTVHYAGTGL
jgi:hypothetical protein